MAGAENYFPIPERFRTALPARQAALASLRLAGGLGFLVLRFTPLSTEGQVGSSFEGGGDGSVSEKGARLPHSYSRKCPRVHYACVRVCEEFLANGRHRIVLRTRSLSV